MAWSMTVCVARIVVTALLFGTLAAMGHAQDRKPTAREITAIRDCAQKNADDIAEGERQCLFNLVATPCLVERI